MSSTVSTIDVIIALDIAAVVVLSIYASHQGILLLLYLRYRLRDRMRRGSGSQGAGHPADGAGERPCEALPRVTVHLPLYNERYVAERVIAAVCALDYPRELLQVQVLDDSTDDTSRIAARAARAARAHGTDVELIRRDNRAGYKAGAMANGLRTASGELIAIFDADFIPPRDFLRKLICERRVFDDPRVGFVQTRWGYFNREFSILTRAQAIMLDMHFVVDQYTRSRSGLGMNFNGSGGVWRRAAIDAAGDWQSDTLTEDLDLSYRAQLRGWRGRYVEDVVCPGELPQTVLAFKRQQARWARGSIQCARKLAGPVLRSSMPLSHKLLALLHMSGYLANVFVLLLAVITPLLILTASGLPSLPPWLSLVSVASLCPILAMFVAQFAQGRTIDFLCDLPAAVVLGVGVSLSNSIAVVAGLFGKSSGEFERTPKSVTTHDPRRAATDLRSGAGRVEVRRASARQPYLLHPDWTLLAELVLGVYTLGVCALLAWRGAWLSVVPVMLYASAFLGVVLGQIVPAAWLQYRPRARQRKEHSRLPSMK